MKVKVTQSCPTLCDPMNYSVHGILQSRILEWVAVPFSRGSFQSRKVKGWIKKTVWTTPHTSKSQLFFIPIALTKILKEVKIQRWQRWKELGTLKIYFWNQISKGYLLLSNCSFALLNFAIWYWNKFWNQCTYVIHHFNMHFLLYTFC